MKRHNVLLSAPLVIVTDIANALLWKKMENFVISSELWVAFALIGLQ